MLRLMSLKLIKKINRSIPCFQSLACKVDQLLDFLEKVVPATKVVKAWEHLTSE